MKRFFAFTFFSTALVIAVSLTFGWNAITAEGSRSYPLPLLEAMYILLTAGLTFAQMIGYYKREVDPSWWHTTFLIGTSTLFWSFLVAIVLAALRALYRLTLRIIRGAGQG